jgi:hypothetical protein
MNLRNVFFILFCLFHSFIYGQTNAHIIKGELFFKQLDFFRLFDADKNMIDSLENMVRNINMDTVNEESKEFYSQCKSVLEKKTHLIPYIYLRADTLNGILFLTKKDYAKFKKYNYYKLVKRHKVVIITAEVTDTEYFWSDAYICLKLISVKKRKGKTYNDKNNPPPILE